MTSNPFKDLDVPTAEESLEKRSDLQDTFVLQALCKLQEALLVFSRQGQLLYWNQRFSKTTGYRYQELLTKQFVDLFAADRKGLAQIFEKKATTFETYLLTKVGKRIPYRFTALTFTVGGQRVVGGTGRKVSRISDQYVSLKKESAGRKIAPGHGAALLTAGGRIVEIDAAGAEMLGWKQQDVQGRSFGSLYADPQHQEEDERMLKAGKTIQKVERTFRRQKGDKVTHLVSFIPRWKKEGYQVVFQAAAVNDKPTKTQQVKALQSSEKMFRTLAEKARIGIYFLQDHTFRYVNPWMAEIFGYSNSQKLVQKGFEALVHPDDKFLAKEQMQRCLMGEKKVVNFTFRGMKASGQTVFVEVFGSRITYYDQPAIIGRVQNIAERRRLQRKVVKIKEEERRRIGQELHDGLASHLTGLKLILSGYIQDLEEGETVALEDLRSIMDLVEQGEEQGRRLSHGLNPVKLSGNRLYPALEELAEHVTHQFEGSCEFIGDVSLPSLDKKLAAHLYRIAQEAATNAAKYAKATTIRIHLKKEHGKLLLVVEDNGVGLPEDDCTTSGTGFLTMKYRAELLGGNCEVQSSSGAGTVIQCQVPF